MSLPVTISAAGFATLYALVASDLRGSVAATYYNEAGTYYALAQVDGEAGFYKDQFNNSRFQNNSHKAYLYVAEAAGIDSYSFRFGSRHFMCLLLFL